MSAVISAVPFALLEQRINRVALERTSNARALIGADAAVMVPGIFNRTPSVAQVGDVGMRARDITFNCPTAQLVVPVEDGTPVTVYYHNQLSIPAGSYKVAPGGRTDHHESGSTLLELELA